jgi:hypothetical protein
VFIKKKEKDKNLNKPGMEVHACNPSTQEAESGGS